MSHHAPIHVCGASAYARPICLMWDSKYTSNQTSFQWLVGGQDRCVGPLSVDSLPPTMSKGDSSVSCGKGDERRVSINGMLRDSVTAHRLHALRAPRGQYDEHSSFLHPRLHNGLAQGNRIFPH